MLLQAPAVNGLHFGLDYIGPGRYPVIVIEFIEPSAKLAPPGDERMIYDIVCKR